MTKQARETGNARRNKAVSMAMKRKEEYLGARVPKELRDRVIQCAKEMGIPVSILIRNTLEDAFGEGSSGRGILSSGKKTSAEEFSSVLGWEEIQLTRTVVCTVCGVTLQQGTQAFLGLGATEPVVICGVCKGRL